MLKLYEKELTNSLASSEWCSTEYCRKTMTQNIKAGSARRRKKKTASPQTKNLDVNALKLKEKKINKIRSPA